MKETVIKYALQILLPFLIDLIKDMIKPEGVIEFRDKVLEWLYKLVEKTETELDDKALELAVKTAFTLANIKTYGVQFVDWAIMYVVHSETKYDDTYLLPVLQKLKEVLVEVEEVEEDVVVSQ